MFKTLLFYFHAEFAIFKPFKMGMFLGKYMLLFNVQRFSSKL